MFWIDADRPHDEVMRAVRQCSHEQVVVARRGLDNVVGVLRKQDLLDAHLDGKALDPAALVRDPLAVHDGTTVQVLEAFKNRPVQMALVIDEYGIMIGIVTQTNLLEALAGEIPDEDEPALQERADGSLLVDGTTGYQEVFRHFGSEPPDGDGEFRTFAGFALAQLGHSQARARSSRGRAVASR